MLLEFYLELFKRLKVVSVYQVGQQKPNKQEQMHHNREPDNIEDVNAPPLGLKRKPRFRDVVNIFQVFLVSCFYFTLGFAKHLLDQTSERKNGQVVR